MQFPNRPDRHFQFFRISKRLQENRLNPAVDQRTRLGTEKILHFFRTDSIPLRLGQTTGSDATGNPCPALAHLPQGQLGRLPIDLIRLVIQTMSLQCRPVRRKTVGRDDLRSRFQINPVRRRDPIRLRQVQPLKTPPQRHTLRVEIGRNCPVSY